MKKYSYILLIIAFALLVACELTFVMVKNNHDSETTIETSEAQDSLSFGKQKN